MKAMRAALVHRFGPTADLALDEMPMLVPVPSEVLMGLSTRPRRPAPPSCYPV